jgi:hypothetical protein
MEWRQPELITLHQKYWKGYSANRFGENGGITLGSSCDLPPGVIEPTSGVFLASDQILFSPAAFKVNLR